VPLTNITQAGRYTIDTLDTQAAQYAGVGYTHGSENVNESFVPVSGFVNLTARTDKKVSGTFEFQGVEENDFSKTVSVTEGKFNVPLE